MALEDLARYESAGLASHFSGRGENDLASYALKEQNEKLGDDKGTRDLMKEFVYSNEKGVKKAIEVYGGEYMKAYESLDLLQLAQYHEAEIGDIAEVKSELVKLSGQTFKDLKEKFDELRYDLTGISKGYVESNDDQKENLTREIQKYQKVLSIIETLQESRFESLRPKISKQLSQDKLKAISGIEIE
ncbi:MAG: hypothetical protein WDZ77_02820 [Candidatus Pacearchaeota archaeon]